jgi:hypothetical protein
VPGATRYIPVGEELTRATPVPAMPAPRCRDSSGADVLCEDQLAQRIVDGDAALAACNADKAAIAVLPEDSPR